VARHAYIIRRSTPRPGLIPPTTYHQSPSLNIPYYMAELNTTLPLPRQEQNAGRGLSYAGFGSWFRQVQTFCQERLQMSLLLISPSDTSTPKDSVVHRIPIEIWEVILREAVRSPLLPFTENGELFDSFMMTHGLFSPFCSSSREYRDITQTTIKRLRLVCRVWSTILRPYMYEYAATDLNLRHVPSKEVADLARRLYITQYHSCQCVRWDKPSCPFTSLRYSGSRRERIPIHRIPLTKHLPSARILILGSIGHIGLDFLRPLSKLCGLSISLSNIQAPWSLKRISTTIPQLAHLQITHVNRYEAMQVEEIRFPHVRNLTVSLDEYQVFVEDPFEGWIFPQLKTLHFEGRTSDSGRRSMYEFASRHGETLVELVDTAILGKFDLPPAYLWDSCPNLNAFGIEMKYIFYNTSTAYTSQWESRSTELPALDLFIYDFPIDWQSPDIALPRIKTLVERLNIRKIVSVYSWEYLERKRASAYKSISKKPESQHWEANRKSFSNMLLRLGVPIYDRFGVPLDDALKTRFI
jgi:hypothetical protein